MQFIRPKLRTVELPIRLYRHPQTHQEVILVGMIHAASAEYYRFLQFLIDSYEQEGFKILYERVKPMTDNERAQLTTPQQQMFRQFVLFRDIIAELVGHVGLSHQLEAMDYRDTWVNTDISSYDLAQKLSGDQMLDLPDGAELQDITDMVPQIVSSLKRPLSLIVAYPLLASPLVALSWLFSRRSKGVKRVILDYRNHYAYKESKPFMAKGSVVMMWGAAHLPGLDSLLQADGYQHTSTVWIPAL